MTLYNSILAKSSLARAFSSVYASISASKIASVQLSPAVTVSMQIPPLASTSVLPEQHETRLHGLWLTTASAEPPDDESTPTSNHQLAKSFALLLLDSESNILKDIEASGSGIAGPLAHYIRSSLPTKSFADVSSISGISLGDIQFFASHLIYWRRARAIPPIHQRDIYIMSPNANMRQLEAAIALYATTFPTLPSLPKMLSNLSGRPKALEKMIPSKDHKQAYFEILAWLMRGGWVTQLRMFALIKVSSAVKAQVAATIAAEEAESSARESSGEATSKPGSKGKKSLNGHTNYNQPYQASVILSPHRASSLESRWIEAVGASIKDEEARQHWPLFTKYFTGYDALQKIPVREGMKRKKVWMLLDRMLEEGVLVGCRHW